jgi:transposase InsO family protein
MEIDVNNISGPRRKLTPEEKEVRRSNGLCLYCGEGGHFVKECPRKPTVSFVDEDVSNKEVVEHYDQSNPLQRVGDGEKPVSRYPSYIREVRVERLPPTELMMATHVSPFVSTLVKKEMTKDHRGLMFLPLMRRNEKLVGLVDTGANVNLMSLAAAQRFQLELVELKTPLRLKTADGSAKQLIVKRTTAIKFDNYPTVPAENFLVADTLPYDSIIGLPWLQRAGAVIDLGKGTVNLVSEPNVSHVNSTSLDNAWEQNLLDPKLDCSYENLPKNLRAFTDVFDKDRASSLPPHREFECEINLKDKTNVIRDCKVYPLPPKHKEALREYIEEMQQKTFITNSTSSFASPIFFVKKPGGGLRPCVDYSELNDLTISDKGPIPLVDDLIRTAKGHKIYTKLDLRGAYNLIRVKPEHQHLTAFKCQYGLFEYRVMPFGLKNAPAVFQRLINWIFRDLLDKGFIAYIDDLLIYGNDSTQHQLLVQEVLKRLKDNNLYCKLPKCEFNVPKTTYLGFELSSEGAKPAIEKTSPLREYPVPTSVKSLQTFLGMTNFYRDYVPNYSKTTAILTSLTKKNIPWVWSPDHQQAFESLISKLTTAPVLRSPHYDRAFVIHSDASDFALGAVLAQWFSDGLHPVAFYSRKFIAAELNYCTYDKELLAIVSSLQHWRHYLLGHTFRTLIFCDHNNLRFFRSQQRLRQRHARWNELLSEYDFVIDFVPGAQNVVADALSRRYNPETAKHSNDHLQLLPEARVATLLYESVVNDLGSGRTPVRALSVQGVGRPGDPGKSLSLIPSLPSPYFRPTINAVDTDTDTLLSAPGEEDDSEWVNPDSHEIELQEGLEAEPEEEDRDDLPSTYVKTNLFGNVYLKTDWPLVIAEYLGTSEWPKDASPYVRKSLQKEVENFKLFGMSSSADPHKLLLRKDQDDNERWKRYAAEKERKGIIMTYHQTLGHLRYQSTLAAVRRSYWFPLMAKAVAETLKSCPNCLLNRNRAGIAPIRPIAPTALPFREWHMDVVGPLVMSKSRNRFIITAVCRATRYTVAVAVQDMQGSTILRVLYGMVMRFGSPERIITDRGKNFIEGALRQYETRVRISHSATTPYHAQANGMVERIHRPIGDALRALVANRQDRWDEYLPEVILGLNARKHATTGHSPFYLAHGVEPRLPVDPLPPQALMKPLTEDEQVEILAADLQETLEELGFSRAEAHRRSLESARKQRGKFRKGAKNGNSTEVGEIVEGTLEPKESFAVGDLVVKRALALNKLDARWEGPYVIVQGGYPGTYRIQSLKDGALSETLIAESNLAPWRMPDKRGRRRDDVRDRGFEGASDQGGESGSVGEGAEERI